MISPEDMEIAKGMSRRWSPNDARFSSDDAYQEMMLALLERDIPADAKYARINQMKEASRNKSIESSYLMRIPAGSWRYLGGAPSHVKYTGLTTDSSGPDGVPQSSLESYDQGYDEVENRVALEQALSGLSEKERARVLKWAERPKSVTGTAYYAVRATLDRLRDRNQRGDG